MNAFCMRIRLRNTKTKYLHISKLCINKNEFVMLSIPHIHFAGNLMKTKKHNMMLSTQCTGNGNINVVAIILKAEIKSRLPSSIECLQKLNNTTLVNTKRNDTNIVLVTNKLTNYTASKSKPITQRITIERGSHNEFTSR